MRESLTSIFDFFVEWPSVFKRIAAIAEDQKLLDSFVEERLEDLVREEHPKDYEDFMKEHADELAAMRKRISDEYKDKLKRYVDAARVHDN